MMEVTDCLKIGRCSEVTPSLPGDCTAEGLESSEALVPSLKATEWGSPFGHLAWRRLVCVPLAGHDVFTSAGSRSMGYWAEARTSCMLDSLCQLDTC